MTRYILGRAMFAIVTLWCVITITFFLLRLVPGGPFDSQRALPPEVEQNLRAAYQLDDPLPLQYLSYLGNLITGDFGPSFQHKDFTVGELIANGLPASLSVGGLALVFALFVGVFLGVTMAARQRRLVDNVLSSLVTLFLALPPIIMGPLLVLAFAVNLGWLPAGGLDSARSYLLPALALALPYTAAFARLAKGGCIDALQESYVLTARAKGVTDARLMFRHVLRPSLIPVLAFLAPATATLLVGSMIVEEIFSIPGLGRYFVQGAINQDYSLVLGAVIVYSALILLLNFLVDISFLKLDPRTRNSIR